MDKRELLAIARGDQNAELVLRNARLVNVFSGAIEATDIAIAGGKVAGIGKGYSGDAEIDLAGRYVAPGLIDAHVHIESSLCVPAQFARAVLPRGVTTVVTDPHEIANVAGVAGIRFMAETSADLPLSVVIMAPSCVPATAMETNGATLRAGDLAGLLGEATVHGLAEVMNFPGVVYGDEDVLAKIAAFGGRPIDGHAPALRDKLLNAYVAAGIGSEHECTTVEEAEEKLARGLYILIREATNAHNLHTLLPHGHRAEQPPHLLLHRRPHPRRPHRPGQHRLHGARGNPLRHRPDHGAAHGDAECRRVVWPARPRRRCPRPARRPHRLRRPGTAASQTWSLPAAGSSPKTAG